MLATPVTPEDSERWDELVERAPMATFLHSRRFLSYHRDRFQDASLLLSDDRQLRAVLPAAVDPADPDRVVSHPGATFGGLVHDGLHTEQVSEALAAAATHYAEAGHTTLSYKPVPHIYHRSPSADDVWSLHSLGATRTGSSLSSAIDLAGRRDVSTRRSRSLKKARDAGVAIAGSATPGDFWPVLESALAGRHGQRPVHTLAEMELVRERFPDAVRVVIGSLDGEVVAGIVLFLTPRVAHVQYMAAGDAGRQVAALDAVAEHCIELTGKVGARYFDFGTSMLDRGDELQTGLHRFKSEFGGGGVIYERYDLALGGDGA